MITPFDWQEGIGNRAQYIEGKLKHGSPVLAVSLAEGILLYTRRRQGRKIFEVYDRLAFAAIGQQSDVEALRAAAVEFAHQEGYNRSEEDVTIQRVVTAISNPVKKAFADFNAAPLVARSLFAEVGDSPDQDIFYILDYDGDFATYQNSVVLAGRELQSDSLLEGALAPGTTVPQALELLSEVWTKVYAENSDENEESLEADLTPEALLIERAVTREDRFRTVGPEPA